MTIDQHFETVLDSDNLDTCQFWKSRDESAKISMNEKLLRLARHGPTSDFVALLQENGQHSGTCLQLTGTYSIDLDIADSSGFSPLSHAAFNGHLEIVEHILNYQQKKLYQLHGDTVADCDKDNIDDTDDEEDVEDGDFENTNNQDGEQDEHEDEHENDEQNSDGPDRDTASETPVLRWKQLFRQFLSRKVKWNGSAALHLACARGHADIVQLLLDTMVLQHNMSLDNSVNATDFDRATPLHCAVLGKHYEICQILLKYGATVDVKDIRGKTPLEWAKLRDLSQYVALLMQYKSNSQLNQQIKDHDENTSDLSLQQPIDFETETDLAYTAKIVETIWENEERKSMESPLSAHTGMMSIDPCNVEEFTPSGHHDASIHCHRNRYRHHNITPVNHPQRRKHLQPPLSYAMNQQFMQKQQFYTTNIQYPDGEDVPHHEQQQHHLHIHARAHAQAHAHHQQHFQQQHPHHPQSMYGANYNNHHHNAHNYSVVAAPAHPMMLSSFHSPNVQYYPQNQWQYTNNNHTPNNNINANNHSNNNMNNLMDCHSMESEGYGAKSRNYRQIPPRHQRYSQQQQPAASSQVTPQQPLQPQQPYCLATTTGTPLAVNPYQTTPTDTPTPTPTPTAGAIATTVGPETSSQTSSLDEKSPADDTASVDDATATTVTTITTTTASTAVVKASNKSGKSKKSSSSSSSNSNNKSVLNNTKKENSKTIRMSDTSQDDPSFDAMKFENKYLKARCETLEKEHKELATEYRQQLIREGNQWRLREEKLMDQLNNKQEQIHELRHTIRRLRVYLDNLPLRLKRNFYADHGNFSRELYENQQMNEGETTKYTTKRTVGTCNSAKMVKASSVASSDSSTSTTSGNTTSTDTTSSNASKESSVKPKHKIGVASTTKNGLRKKFYMSSTIYISKSRNGKSMSDKLWRRKN